MQSHLTSLIFSLDPGLSRKEVNKEMPNDAVHSNEETDNASERPSPKEDAGKILREIKDQVFGKPNRIADGFHRRFVLLRLKIHHVLQSDQIAELDRHVYIESILVDCRALFLENKLRHNNFTLQNFYRSRGFSNFAQEIDDFFDRHHSCGFPLRDVIKRWVDKHVVHGDFITEPDEQQAFANVDSIIDRGSIDNIFISILAIADTYERFRREWGSNIEEQASIILQRITER